MWDILCIVLTIAFFAAAAAFVRGCATIEKEPKND